MSLDGSVVYYGMRADGLTKIGTSQNLESRVKRLQREHNGFELLTWHPGDYTVESNIHRYFDLLRVEVEGRYSIEREWFRPSPRLMQWIMFLDRWALRIAVISEVMINDDEFDLTWGFDSSGRFEYPDYLFDLFEKEEEPPMPDVRSSVAERS